MPAIDRTLRRIPEQGQIAGVCAGLAEYFDLDVTLIRVIFVILAFVTGGAVIVAYLILAVVMPTAVPKSKKTSSASASANKLKDDITQNLEHLSAELQANDKSASLRNYLGLALVAFGAWLLLVQFFPQWGNIRWAFIWPVLIILAGLLIATRRRE